MCLNTSKKIYHFLALNYIFEKGSEFVCFLNVVCFNNICVQIMIFVFYLYYLVLESDKFFWMHLNMYILIFYNNFYVSIKLNHVTQRYKIV